MQNFIKTTDRDTAEKMEREGFVLVDYSDGVWTFIHDKNIKYDVDKKKVHYTNQLHF